MTDRSTDAGARWPGYGRVFGWCAVAIAAALIPVLIYQLAYVWLMIVGAVLIAALLRVVAEPFQRYTPLPLWAGLILAGLILVGLVGLTLYVFGSEMSSEFSDVMRRVTDSAHQIRDRLEHTAFGKYLMGRLSSSDFSATGMLQKVFSVSTSLIAALIVILISAIYITAQPALYRRGVVILFPERHQRRVDDMLVAIGKGLRLWLIGQLIEMLIIALLSMLSVWLIGLPSVVALGLIAFAAEFIPFLGPILAAIPAVLVALTQGDRAAILTVIAYLLIHQVEGNIVTPMIQRRLILIPPALTLLGLAAVAVLFGFGGIVFAGPIVAILYVGIRKLYLGVSVDDRPAASIVDE